MIVSYLMLSMLFGTFGLGFVLYAKNAGKLLPAIAGAALMVVPYFLTNIVLMVIVCAALTALPFIFHEL